MSNLPVKVEVNVLSNVDPDPSLLMQARKLIQQDGQLQKLFIRSKKEKKAPEWLAHRIVSRLTKLMSTSEYLGDVARYLADEYQQIGDGALLINPTSGKAIARLQEEDFYTPAPVAREGSGTLVQRAPTVRPEVQAFITQWIFDESREQELSTDLAKRVHTTALLKKEGDPRLRIVTRSGRKDLVSEIRESLPSVFESFCSGSVKDFLSFFSVTLGVEGVEGLEALLSGRSYARSITPIVDPKTFNLKFDTRGSILSSFGSQWVRDIARSIVLQVPQVSEPINSEELTSEHLQNAKLWVASPEVCGRLKEVDPSIYTLPLEGVPTVGFHEYAGTILINPNSIECEGREIHERWEIYGSVDFKVWLNPTVPLDIRGARSKDISVELVQ